MKRNRLFSIIRIENGQVPSLNFVYQSGFRKIINNKDLRSYGTNENQEKSPEDTADADCSHGCHHGMPIGKIRR